MATIQEKMARLARAQESLESFVNAGGDLKSQDAVPAGLEFVNAFADLANELGYDILKPIKDDYANRPRRA